MDATPKCQVSISQFHNICSIIVFINLHILLVKGWCNMQNDNTNNTTSNNQDLQQEDAPKEVIPDEVPRKDGPGGE